MAWTDRPYARTGSGPGGSASGRDNGHLWLIGVTVGVSAVIWTVFGGRGGPADRIVDALALRSDRLLSLDLWRPVSYVFLHGDPGHLFWNMVILFFVGRILEPYFGTRRFVALYLAFGVFASLGFPLELAMAGFSGPGIVSLGASGALMGLIALLGSRFPMMEIRLFGVIPVKAWVLAALVVALDFLWLQWGRGGPSGVARGVHLAGAAGGFAYGLLWPLIAVVVDRRQAEQERVDRVEQRRHDQERGQELDRILKKIQDSGMDQLTEEERAFLLAQSQRLKERSKR